MAGKFEIRKSSSGQYYFNLKAANGEPLPSSEMYISKGGAENGIRSVRENAPLIPVTSAELRRATSLTCTQGRQL